MWPQKNGAQKRKERGRLTNSEEGRKFIRATAKAKSKFGPPLGPLETMWISTMPENKTMEMAQGQASLSTASASSSTTTAGGQAMHTTASSSTSMADGQAVPVTPSSSSCRDANPSGQYGAAVGQHGGEGQGLQQLPKAEQKHTVKQFGSGIIFGVHDPEI